MEVRKKRERGSRKEKGNKESGREKEGEEEDRANPKPLSIKYTSVYIRYSVSGIVL